MHAAVQTREEIGRHVAFRREAADPVLCRGRVYPKLVSFKPEGFQGIDVVLDLIPADPAEVSSAVAAMREPVRLLPGEVPGRAMQDLLQCRGRNAVGLSPQPIAELGRPVRSREPLGGGSVGDAPEADRSDCRPTVGPA
ncbi:hypothetical protein GCM10009741_60310 [Kribbella lupini]|uniref:Uncharacterized protein n=1 Tax=Kribbella lupini TaxID=291602 RepID=A0ABN2BXJ7_9ACTN